jgi:O-antigen ligase
MLRHSKTLFVILAVAVVVLVSGGRNLIGVALLTALLPVYAMALASVFLILSIAIASVIVPIGRLFLSRLQSEAAIDQTPPVTHVCTKEWRKAA